MFTNTTTNTTSENNSLLQVVAKETGKLIIKVFDIKGMKAKTIHKYCELDFIDFQNDLFDLQKGQYILNAFLDGNFVKSFKYIKEA